jgi:hypothetical protein
MDASHTSHANAQSFPSSLSHKFSIKSKSDGKIQLGNLCRKHKKPAILVRDKLIRGLQVLDQICFLEIRNDVERSNPNED